MSLKPKMTRRTLGLVLVLSMLGMGAGKEPALPAIGFPSEIVVNLQGPTDRKSVV